MARMPHCAPPEEDGTFVGGKSVRGSSLRVGNVLSGHRRVTRQTDTHCISDPEKKSAHTRRATQLRLHAHQHVTSTSVFSVDAQRLQVTVDPHVSNDRNWREPSSPSMCSHGSAKSNGSLSPSLLHLHPPRSRSFPRDSGCTETDTTPFKL